MISGSMEGPSLAKACRPPGTALWETRRFRLEATGISLLQTLLLPGMQAAWAGRGRTADSKTLLFAQSLIALGPSAHQAITEVKAVHVPWKQIVRHQYCPEMPLLGTREQWWFTARCGQSKPCSGCRSTSPTPYV